MNGREGHQLSEHKASLSWNRDTDDFKYPTYTRDHTWSFEGGQVVSASAAPEFLGNADRVDPEESFVASISACHMLTFLTVAAKRRFVVDSYSDEAVGYLEKNAAGKLAITRVELRPRIAFSGDPIPTPEQMDSMHHLSHEQCFIANSVNTEIVVLSLE